jgi:hypothetical protein
LQEGLTSLETMLVVSFQKVQKKALSYVPEDFWSSKNPRLDAYWRGHTSSKLQHDQQALVWLHLARQFCVRLPAQGVHHQ